MKRKKIDSFTLFVILLLALILTLLGMLLAGMKEEKRQFTVLLPLGDLAYDEDFLQKAKKIKGIKEIWPVIEVPVVIKIEDYEMPASRTIIKRATPAIAFCEVVNAVISPR